MNSFGKNFRVSVFGESHGEVVGVLIDGVPAGVEFSVEDFARDIARRSSSGEFATPRREADIPHIRSGVFNGHTTGAPLCIEFDNLDTQSSDYSFLPSTPRPGHADYAAHRKFSGMEDYRGGGAFSGRMTIALVAAGVVAKKILPQSISIYAGVVRLGGSDSSQRWKSLLAEAKEDGDSLGGVVECQICGVPCGVGEPFWDSVEGLLSHAVFAIPGVRGIEFGDGFAAADMLGSEHNDPLGPSGPERNGAGGVNGGLANGSPIVFRVAFKPTSSIARAQVTYNFEQGEKQVLSVGGRHDVCFALRTPVIVEAVSAIVLADLMFRA